MKHDLWNSLGQEKQPHALGKRIMRAYNNDEEKARQHLKSLNLKIVVTKNVRAARALEQLLILELNPRYNK